jgi:BirA family biotin operon repressor/biotin-[acetyl-CoA-carboxylase] ligase
MTDRQAAVLIRELADGGFRSGERLADLLGVSRTAVWKRIRAIGRATGLEIHAVRGKGYRLAEPLELLDAGRIAGDVRSGSSFDPAIEVHSTLASTSGYLAERLHALDSGTIVFAEHQTAGRGRRGREWVSPYGANLYFSVYHRFSLAMQELGGLSLAVGAAVAEVLSASVPAVALKWPNDLLVDGRKLAGILVDVHGLAEGPVDTVIGIGLNVAMPAQNAASIGQPWTDLQQLMQQRPSRNRLAAELCIAILELLDGFHGALPRSSLEAWRRFDAWHGMPVVLVRGSRSVQGIHAGIADDGSLRLEVDGSLQLFQSGEVSLRKPGAC